jgi:pimeloyl-ACP methyl ester carboxylesterase
MQRLMIIALSALVPAMVSAADGPKPTSRAEATAVIRELRRIVTPDGMERLEKVRIGGTDQWVSIRGTDKKNPVLLVIHGGPGYPLMPFSWWFGRGWEEYFTVVEWDQRGSGKTYFANDPQRVRPTLTLDRMVTDAEEMTAWLRKQFGKDKIFVLGHSWGTYMGVEVALRHPEWLHAYIGVAQIADMPESERRGWAFAMDAARRAGNAQAVRELQSIAPYAVPGKPIALKDLFVQRKWLTFYGGAMAYRSSNKAETDAAELSPDYSDNEFVHFWEGNDFTESMLLAKIVNLDLRNVTTLKCPLFLFEGRHDYNLNSTVSADWLARMHAPAKKLIWFENSAHEIMTEEPGKVLLSLVRDVRPLAVRAGDAPPEQP